MIAPRCLIGGDDGRDLFQVDCAGQEKGFRRTRRLEAAPFDCRLTGPRGDQIPAMRYMPHSSDDRQHKNKTKYAG